MATQVVMPHLGAGVTESKISRWLKQVGDEVRLHEPIVEVETDKVTTEVMATASGVLLAILAPEGATVQTGAPLAFIGERGETLDIHLPPSTFPLPLSTFPDAELVPHTTMRRSIAEHMVRSKHTSPHAATFFEVDMSRVAAHREANRAAFEREGVSLTLTAYLVAAAVVALKAHPQVNSSFSDEGLVVHRQINIGLAVSLGPEGLIVPVLRNADQLDLMGIARNVNALVERARNKRLAPDQMTGSTFTLTNHGTSGSLLAMPIINQPNAAILSAGALHKRPVVVTQNDVDVIAIRPMLYLGLTFDHRVLDGAMADMFLATVKHELESWSP